MMRGFTFLCLKTITCSLAVVMVAGFASANTITYQGSVSNETQWVANGYGNLGYAFIYSSDPDIEIQKNHWVEPYKRGGAIYIGDTIDGETPTAGQTIKLTHTAEANYAGLLYNETTGMNYTQGVTSSLLENPDGGTFESGKRQTSGLSDGFYESFIITFDQAPIGGNCVIGVLVGACETMGYESTVGGATGNLRDVPYMLQLEGTNSAETKTTQLALEGSPDWFTVGAGGTATGISPDWYFFEVAGITDGDVFTLSTARVYGADGHKNNPINGVVIAGAVPEPSTLALLFAGLAGLLMYGWRKKR